MTTPTLEDQARCEAALRSKTVWNEFDALKDHPGKWWLRSADQSITPMTDITTAPGREAILELCRFLIIPRVPEGWWYSTDRNEWAATYAKAITAAWYEFVNRWKEQNDA